MSVHDQWQAGIQDELDFWHAVFAGKKFPDYRREIMQRLDRKTPVAAYIAGRLPACIATPEVKILDVAAGPVSCVGWHVGGQIPQITPIDALAPQYRAMLDEFGLEPPVYTQHCDGEDIVDSFPAGSFDLAHIRNALDHCYDALRVLRNMLTVLKPGGVLIVCGYTDEGETGNYEGLHQWNVRADGGHLIVWRPGERHDINEIFGNHLSTIEAWQDDAARWTSVTLRKN